MSRRVPLSRRQLLVALGVATVVFDVILIVLDQRMKEAGGPSILGFEFAGSREQAAAVMAEWGPSGRHYARLSLWLDYGFMLSYGSFFALAALATRDFARVNGMRWLAAAGALAPIAAVSAAAFDAIENAFLLLTLGGHGAGFAPPIATVCASLKFTLIALAILYALWGLAARVVRRGRRSAPASQA